MPPIIYIPQTYPEQFGDTAYDETHFNAMIAKGMLEYGLMTADQVEEYGWQLWKALGVLQQGDYYDALLDSTRTKTSHIVEGQNFKVGDKVRLCTLADGKTPVDLTPVAVITRVSKIVITYHKKYYRKVRVGNRLSAEYAFQDGEHYTFYQGDEISEELLPLENLIAQEGFGQIEHFFQWFNQDFEGQLVSWIPIKSSNE